MELDEAYRILDDTAHWTQQINATLTFSVTSLPYEQAQSFRLRYAEVIGRGWAQPQDFPDGLERDVYDDDALHLVGKQGDHIIAVARLVLPSPVRRLPTEAAFNLTLPNTADLGRAVVEADNQKTTRPHQVFLGLLGRAWLEARAQGVQNICGVINPLMLRLYRMAGYSMTILGEPQDYWGEKRLPAQLDLIASASAQLNLRPPTT